ncbi:MAG: YebC/PmpR family DNA-binding transcriptional regulator [Spirochaetia bacterium]|nr:YebC/PmpR family DNA-binding transcriptional regulator [Spirochaetia bacterium]
MSGHSRWAQIKRKKGAIDVQRGKIFSKLGKEISVAARLGGGEAEANPRLRLAILKAKEHNMPAKNIENAVKRGAGNMEGVTYEEITYEAYGPGGIGLMISCLTDNKNRSASEVRSVLTKNGCSMATVGAVGFQFEKKGLLHIEKSAEPNEEKMMELALEAGAEDVVTESEGYTVKTDIGSYISVLDKLKAKNVPVAESSIGYTPKNFAPADAATQEKIQELISALEDLDDVEAVASNEESS